MYSAKLTGLKAKDVMHLISNMPAHVDCKFAQTPDAAAPDLNGAALARVEPSDFVILGKLFKRRDGTMPCVMVQKIEKYERKHGAGSMTRGILTKQMEEYSDAPGAVITAGLARGIIKGVKS